VKDVLAKYSHHHPDLRPQQPAVFWTITLTRSPIVLGVNCEGVKALMPLQDSCFLLPEKRS
jgi:hypothetical protein